MNEANKEQLSAFMDGEIDGLDKNLAGQMPQDPELLGAWSRYHLVSDCLKGNLPEHLDRELAGKISKSLEGEPAIVAPVRLSLSLVKPAAGFAIAASVAALAIFGIQQQQPGGPHEVPQSPVAQTVPGDDGVVQAPVRQVSTASTDIISECKQPSESAGQPHADNGRQAAGRGSTGDEASENCR